MSHRLRLTLLGTVSTSGRCEMTHTERRHHGFG
jgi:hypothetical protein